MQREAPFSFPSLYLTSSLPYLPPVHTAGRSSNRCEEIKVPCTSKPSFPLLNNTRSVGTPCNRDPGSDTPQRGEGETKGGEGGGGSEGDPNIPSAPPQTHTSRPGPCRNQGCGVARGKLQAVATVAAGPTLASILLRRPDPPRLGTRAGPRRSRPGTALALPSAGLWRRRTGPARPRAGSQARVVGANDGGHGALPPAPTRRPRARSLSSLLLPGSHLLVEGVHGLHVGGG